MPIFFEIFIRGILNGGTYALLGMGLSLIYGIMNVVNFAHGSTLMLSMYVTFMLALYLSLSLPLIFLLSIPIFLIVGYAIYKFFISQILQAPEINQLLLTLGLVYILQGLCQIIWGADFLFYPVKGAATFISLGHYRFDTVTVLNFLFSVLVIILLFLTLYKTKIGFMIRATSQNKELGAICGVNIRYIYLLSFLISTVLAALGGVLFFPSYYVSPFVGAILTLKAFIIVVLGGLGNVMGALVAGLILGVAESLASYYLGTRAELIASFLIFILILTMRPSGLFGTDQ
jgi:branched-chain amino acid transport system permease protein